MINKNESQVFETSTKTWIKYNNKTGKVIERSKNNELFRNVRIQNTVLKPRRGGK